MSLRQILIDTFTKSNIPENIDDLKIGDFEEWDSIGNFNLILAVEQKYKVQFDIENLDKIKSIKDIKKFLENDFSK
jgi:acyl carrier protein